MSLSGLDPRVVTVAAACLVLAPASVRALGPARYDCGEPTPAEQHVLEMINRARADPSTEGTRLGFDINEGVPNGTTAVARPPLAMNKSLLASARAHSEDMYARKYFAHSDPDGNDPFQRMAAAGYSGGQLGENIAAGSSHTAASLEDLLMRDPNYPGRGHRVNLLNIGSGSPYREIGIGYDTNAVPISGAAAQNVNGLKDFLTEDFGASSTGPFVLGVVYADANANGKYDAGEGLGGVTVMPNTGGFYAVTGAAGGYAFPAGTSGTIGITASGGALPSPVTANVTLTGVNVKVDFLPGAASGGGASASLVDTDGDGFPDELESAEGASPNDAGDTPFGGAPASPLPLAVPRLDIHLNFAAPANDRLTFSFKVPIAAGFDPDGKKLVVDVGGIVREFTLDSHGRGAGVPTGAVQLSLRRSHGTVPAQRARAAVKLSQESVAAALADEGLLNATTHGRSRVSVPAIVLLDGSYFTSLKALHYTAKVGKSGAAK